MKIRVKNLTDKYVERAYVLFKPYEEKDIEISNSRIFEIKSCVYLGIIEENPVNLIKEVNEDTYKCEVCSKEYETKASLNRHMKKHEEV